MHATSEHGSSGVDSNALLLIGFAIIVGALAASLFKRLRIPQVVGYIVIGLVVGQSGFNVIDAKTLDALEPFNFFALGLIGFHIGGSLSVDLMRKRGKQLAVILAGEALGATFVAGLLSFVVAWIGTGNLALSAAIGIVLGSVASATAPAATVGVITECRARGPLTTTALAIVALDDIFAVTLFSVGVSIAAGLTGENVGVGETILGPLRMLGFAALIGGAFGAVLAFVIRRVNEPEAELVIVIGAVLLAIGLSSAADADPIMPALALGFTVANLAPSAAKQAIDITEHFAPPVYVLFFVMAGARMHIGGLAGWMWLLALSYVVGRLLGKIIGAGLGATLAGAAPVLRRYLGITLASQAGVAVGLSIMAGMRLGEEIGQTVIAVVATTVFFFEIVGPALVKVALVKSGEAGRNVTEEDLISTRTVADVMERLPIAFTQKTELSAIFRAFGNHDHRAFAVLDSDSKLAGLITVGEIRDSLATEGLGGFLLADDLMTPAKFRVNPDVPLRKALDAMRTADVEVAPVVAPDDKGKLVGMIDIRSVRRHITSELLKAHADEETLVRTMTTVITRK